MNFKSYLFLALTLFYGATVYGQWVLQSSGTTGNLTGVHALTGRRCVAISELGQVLLTQDGGQTWVANNSQLGYSMYDVAFVSGSLGYAVGGDIFRTTDAGGTWTRMQVPWTSTLRSIHFPSSMVGYVAGDGGFMGKTTDGGATWQTQNTGSTTDFSSVSFGDAQNGLVVGVGGAAMRTTNGGATWTSVAVGTTLDLYAVTMTSPSVGLAGGNGGVLFMTGDGGQSWSPINSGTTDRLFDIYFVNATQGFIAAGGLGNAHVLRTDNGGGSWSQQGVGGVNPLKAIHGATVDTLWAVGDLGLIATTTNGGQVSNAWYPQNSTVSHELLNVFFSDNNHGWASSYSGSLLRTTDGGQNWLNRTLTTSGGKSVFALDSLHMWMAGEGWYSKVWKSNDGGITWADSGSIPNSSCADVYFFDQDTGYAVGMNSGHLILKSMNGGANWTNVSACAEPYEIWFVDRRHGMATTFPGVYMTNDGGTNWNFVQVDPSTNPMYSCHGGAYPDSMHAFTAGNVYKNGSYHATIHRSTDGGQTWGLVYEDSTCNCVFWDIDFPTPQVGFAVGDGGRILRTTDGGSTWAQQFSGTTNRLNSVHFPSPSRGYACGENGTILTTQLQLTGISASAGAMVPASLYPNPVGSKVYLKVPEGIESGPYLVRISDLQGRLVCVHELHDSGLAMELPAGLSKGLMFYEVRAGDKVVGKGKLLYSGY